MYMYMSKVKDKKKIKTTWTSRLHCCTHDQSCVVSPSPPPKMKYNQYDATPPVANTQKTKI